MSIILAALRKAEAERNSLPWKGRQSLFSSLRYSPGFFRPAWWQTKLVLVILCIAFLSSILWNFKYSIQEYLNPPLVRKYTGNQTSSSPSKEHYMTTFFASSLSERQSRGQISEMESLRPMQRNDIPEPGKLGGGLARGGVAESAATPYIQQSQVVLPHGKFGLNSSDTPKQNIGNALGVGIDSSPIRSVGRRDSIPLLRQMTASEQRSVPPFNFSGHIFSDKRPGSGRAIVDGHVYKAGDAISADFYVVAIDTYGVVFRHRDTVFRVEKTHVFQ